MSWDPLICGKKNKKERKIVQKESSTTTVTGFWDVSFKHCYDNKIDYRFNQDTVSWSLDPQYHDH